MRVVASAALLVLVALAGCSGDAAPPDEPGEQDDGRRSVGGAQGGNKTKTEDVPFFEGPISLKGPGEQAYDVQVPVNLTGVEAHITSPGPVHQEFDLAMQLTGCGGFDRAMSSSGSFGGSVSRTYEVCGPATPGAQTFTVSGGAGQYLEGTLRLVGQRPLANATS